MCAGELNNSTGKISGQKRSVDRRDLWTGKINGQERSVDKRDQWTGEISGQERSMDRKDQWTGEISGQERSVDRRDQWTREINGQERSADRRDQCSSSALPVRPWKFSCNLVSRRQSHSSSCILHALPMFAFALMYSWLDVIFLHGRQVGSAGQPTLRKEPEPLHWLIFPPRGF